MNPSRESKGSNRSFDSAEKPQMVKKQQLKTPPKQSGHSRKIVHNRSWNFLYSTLFWIFFMVFQNRGVFQQNQSSGTTPLLEPASMRASGDK